MRADQFTRDTGWAASHRSMLSARATSPRSAARLRQLAACTSTLVVCPPAVAARSASASTRAPAISSDHAATSRSSNVARSSGGRLRYQATARCAACRAATESPCTASSHPDPPRDPCRRRGVLGPPVGIGSEPDVVGRLHRQGERGVEQRQRRGRPGQGGERACPHPDAGERRARSHAVGDGQLLAMAAERVESAR